MVLIRTRILNCSSCSRLLRAVMISGVGPKRARSQFTSASGMAAVDLGLGAPKLAALRQMCLYKNSSESGGGPLSHDARLKT